MGRIVCELHGTTGIVHVSNDIASRIKNRGARLDLLRYDIDWFGGGRASASYFVSLAFAEQFGLPKWEGTPYGSGFEEEHAAAFDQLTTVCDRCFDEYLNRAT